MAADDEAWRRPPGASDMPPGPAPGGGAPGGGPPPYAGPPPTVPPPAGWRPPTVVEPPPPRALPAQDDAGLDEAERGARTLTYGVGMVAGAIALILLCAICSRAFF